MNIQELDEKGLTILAFLIGLAIIDSLDSTEQAAVGGFIMLIGQTVSTNSGFKFNKDWKSQTKTTVSRDTLNKTTDIIKDGINNYKKSI